MATTLKYLNNINADYAGIKFEPSQFNAAITGHNQVTYTAKADNTPFSHVHPPPPGNPISVPLNRGDSFTIKANGDLVIEKKQDSSTTTKK